MKKLLIALSIVTSLTLAPVIALAIGDVNPDQTSTCIDLQNNLRYRSTDAQTGGEVSPLQSFLQDNNFLSSDPTGFFGRQTLQAVKTFQGSVGLDQTGFVGPLTRGKIRDATCGGTIQTPIISSLPSLLAPSIIAPSTTIPPITINHPSVMATVGAPQPYNCQPKDPSVKFLSQVLPPGQMTPGQVANVSITVANCSGTTWVKGSGSTGFKLGSRLPMDNIIWGTSRVDLPADVGNNQQVTIPFSVQAPVAENTYLFQWGLLNEGVRWYQPYSPPAIVGVGSVVSCPAADSVKNTGNDATAALQGCVDATPIGKTLEIPAGEYTLLNQIRILKSITLRTAGTAGNTQTCLTPGAPACATFKAAAGFPQSHLLWQDAFGLFHIAQEAGESGINGVAFDHIALDGNRQNRLASSSVCDGNPNSFHFCVNIEWFGNNSKIFYSASMNALTSTGFGLNGNNNVFAYNLIKDNGDHFSNYRWSDGLTMTDGRNATVMYNTFKDNSDVDFVFARAVNANIQFNAILHEDSSKASWAGLALDAFNSSGLVDFTGADVSYNTIDCNYSCGFGLNVGHAWYSTQPNLLGGYVHDNTITRARQGINIDGAGTAANPLTFTNNAVTNSGGYQSGCGISGAFNLSPDSIVNLSGGTPADSQRIWHDCTFDMGPPPPPMPPVITSALTASGTVGSAFSYAITASNNPTSFNAIGLPAGLSVNTSTGVISGTPTVAGTSNVAVSATNASGTGSVTVIVTIASASLANAAQFISQSVPSPMTVGQFYAVSVTMKNTGSAAWTPRALYRLGSQNPQDNSTWSTSRVSLAAGESVALGQQKTFAFNVTAPITPGTYSFQWRMVQDGVQWFGDTSPMVTVNVTSSSPTVINGSCGSSNGGTFSSPPTTGLCTAGTASAVSGTGPYTWTCSGSNGGTTANCSATGGNPGVPSLANVKVYAANTNDARTQWVQNGSVGADRDLYFKMTGLNRSNPPKVCAGRAGTDNCANASTYRYFTESEWGSSQTEVITYSAPGTWSAGTYNIYGYYPATGFSLAVGPKTVGSFTVTSASVKPPTCHYPQPAQGCAYVQGPDYDPTTQCGKILQCTTDNLGASVTTGDSGWKQTQTPGSSWHSLDFDDISWQSTVDEGAYGVNPWGTVPQFPSGTGAHWIWYYDSKAANDTSTVYFRKTFVPSYSSATLTISGDNSFNAYVNGGRVASGTDWTHSQTATISLTPNAKNVIAIVATNGGGPGGVIAEIRPNTTAQNSATNLYANLASTLTAIQNILNNWNSSPAR